MKPLIVAALTVCTTPALAQKSMPGDHVYDFHSERQGSCVPLHWHIVATAAGVLSGTIAWEDGSVVARVSGTIDPLVQVERYGKPLSGNPQSRSFRMIATEAGSKHRIADITGTIWPNGWLNANVQGPGMTCQNVRVQWAPAPSR